MKPDIETYVFHDVIIDVGQDKDSGSWFFHTAGRKFWLSAFWGKPQLEIEDGVRITITKEPKPDAQPVPTP